MSNNLAEDGISWLIIGAQTKPYKPPKIEWVQEIVEAADKAGVPVFLKDNLKPLLENDHRAFMNPLYWKDGYYTSPEHPNIDRTFKTRNTTGSVTMDFNLKGGENMGYGSKDGRGKGQGMRSGGGRNRNTGGCSQGGPGYGKGGGRGKGQGRKG